MLKTCNHSETCAGGTGTSPRPVFFQPKLSVNEPGDAFEQEADAMADTVMRMPDPGPTGAFFKPAANGIQRKCQNCEEEEKKMVQRKCKGCEEEEHLVRRKESGEGVPTPSSAVEQTLASSGQPLDAGTRTFMEQRFGQDFGHVQIHDDGLAHQSSADIQAKAYTHQNHIVFGAGEYQPGTEAGKQLLAHELTHTLQQKASGGEVQRLIRDDHVNCPGHDPRPADRRASALLTNAIAAIDAARAARAATPGAPAVTTIGNAMHTAFRLNPADASNWDAPAPHFGLLLIRRRLEGVRDYIDSVVFTITCRPDFVQYTIPGCDPDHCGGPGDRAFSCRNPHEIVLCPAFWALTPDLQAKTVWHEVHHIAFPFIFDWHHPDSVNAHCYDQFIALANGFNLPVGQRCH